MKKFVVLACLAFLLACEPQGVPATRDAADFPTHRETSLEAQSFSRDDLTRAAIHIEVPAGEWRSLLLTDLDAQGLYLASQPAPGARPYFGIGNGPSSGRLSFAAPPQDQSYATAALGWWRSVDSSGETVIVLGSNAGPTQFAIGYAPPDFDLTSVGVVIVISPGGSVPTLAPETARSLADDLFSRPHRAARFEPGTGGFAGTIYRQRVVDGSVIEFVSGDISLEKSVLASADPGVEVGLMYAISGQAEQLDFGVHSYIVLTLSHSGSTAFSYDNTLPPQRYQDLGAGAGIGAYGTAGSLPLGNTSRFLLGDPAGPNVHGSGIIDIKQWAVAIRGSAALDMHWQFTGREGARIVPADNPAGPTEDFVRAFTPDIYWLDWGYVNADFAALYGWEMSDFLQIN